MNQRIAMGIEYAGTAYCGWQRQREARSVQAVVEQAIAKVADQPIVTVCAGRTDAKVHAYGQVIHFDTTAVRTNEAWLRGVNTYLPRDIRVHWNREVPSLFDARRCAQSRRYVYIILNDTVSPALLHHRITWIPHPLDIDSMQRGANYLLGTHDFSAFRGSQCQAKTPVRTVLAINIVRHQQYILMDVTANAFLHHMVRNIVGALLLVGRHRYSPEWIATLLASRDRKQAAVMAPAQGLYLLQVCYPAFFKLSMELKGIWFSFLLGKGLVDCEKEDSSLNFSLATQRVFI